jgi:hypothetical protein
LSLVDLVGAPWNFGLSSLLSPLFSPSLFSVTCERFLYFPFLNCFVWKVNALMLRQYEVQCQILNFSLMKHTHFYFIYFPSSIYPFQIMPRWFFFW